MAEPSDEDIDLANRLYEEWSSGRTSKSQIEIREWGAATAHGRRFDRFIHNTLGLNTSQKSKQTERIAELERLLRNKGWLPGGAPQWETQLQHGRQAAFAALRAWNDPSSSFKTESFALLLVTAWNSVCLAILQKKNEEWREVDEEGKPVIRGGRESSLGIHELIAKALLGDKRAGVRKNIEFWAELRNQVAHRYLPAVDALVIPYAQAALLNLENVLEADFGKDYLLGDELSVPLQLSGFRDPGILGSLKRLQSGLPLDVQTFLNSQVAIPDDLLNDPTFTLRIAFLPVVPSSGKSPDAVAYFVKPDDVDDALSDALEKYVVVPKVSRPPRPNLGATAVVDAVQAGIPFKFWTNAHAKAACALKVRPKTGAADPTKTDARFCEYVPAAKIYVYNDAWVKRLINELATEEGFVRLIGTHPRSKES